MEADKTWKLQADKTWQKNAATQVVLNSIFAALAALWITVALGEEKDLTISVKFFETVFALSSFLLFAISAEGTTTAYEEKDVLKYVYYLLWYNIGVLLIALAIELYVFERFELFKHFWTGFIAFVILFVVLLQRWICDAVWLPFGDNEKFQDYLKELKDEEKPKWERGCVMSIMFCKRLRTEQ
jgi:hypothetical protein